MKSRKEKFSDFWVPTARGKKLNSSVDQALEFTGLTDRRKDYPKKFSGGMKRRLNIACAIVHCPELIIMDEPTVGIDPQSRNHILKSIKTLNEEGSTIIYTSHYMEEVEELCNRILIMDHGRVIAKGTKEQLKSMVAVDETIDMELSSMNYSIIEKIKSLDGVIDCIATGLKLKVISKKKSRSLNKVIGAVSDCDTEITSLNVEKLLLELEGDIEVVAIAANGREACEKCGTFSPDIVLMDIRMPDVDGVPERA